MRVLHLQKRVKALEASKSSGSAPSCRDWRRKLAKCMAALEGRPWTCAGNPEQKVLRDAKQARYKEYFDQLEAIR